MFASLDAHSLIFAGGVSAFMTMLAMVAARRGFPESIAGLELWGAGSCAQAAGSLILAFRGALPDVVTALLGPTLLVLGQALMLHAIRRFHGDRFRPALIYTPPVVMLLGAAFFCFLIDQVAIRAAIYSATSFIPLALSVHLLATGFRERLRAPARLSAAAFSVVALLLLYQALHSIVLEIGVLDSRNFSYVLFVALYGGLNVLATFGFLLMANERLHAEIERMATLDSLTEVFNRRTFVKLAEVELARSARTGSKAAVVFLDMDRFKNINDSHGHAVGDRILLEFVGCTRGVLRRQDVFGRFGGEEFCLLLPETGIEDAVHAAERVRSALERVDLRFDGLSVRCTVSAGVSGTELHGTDFDRMLRGADEALYAAKRNGRNRVEIDPAPRPSPAS
jgi:diguanylate cyclase (GGDEF)-like protein